MSRLTPTPFRKSREHPRSLVLFARSTISCSASALELSARFTEEQDLVDLVGMLSESEHFGLKQQCLPFGSFDLPAMTSATVAKLSFVSTSFTMLGFLPRSAIAWGVWHAWLVWRWW
eukprot:s3468_g8.t1